MNTTRENNGESASLPLIDATIAAFDQGQAASPQEGLSLLNNWFAEVRDNEQTDELVSPMRALHDELQSGNPSNTKLVEILNELADKTDAQASQADEHLNSRLTTLATALRNFAGQLSTAV